MISKKFLVIVSLVLAMLYHFILHLDLYGPTLGKTISNSNSFLALGSSLIMLFIYITTNWRVDLKGSKVLLLYEIVIIYVFICYFRGFLNVYRSFTIKEMLFSPYAGLSLFPMLFFIVGVNLKYFYFFNRMIFIYCLVIFVLSLPLISYFELQYFLLMPLFYIIVTFPMQTTRDKILTFVLAVVVVITSTTNRAGVFRISISYMIIILFYMVLKMKINKRLITVVVFLALIIPFYLIYLGVSGKDVFKMVLGENKLEGYGQENIRSDTRTFLYVDVFRDLKINKAFAFGKGINGGYASEDFETFNRVAIEVGFLQIILKTGILGFLLYSSLIISAIYNALNNSSNYFIKYLGLLLCGYFFMLFIENIIAFNLLNVVIWCVVGMCQSKELRALSDHEIKDLFLKGLPKKDMVQIKLRGEN
jgi:hypothetical protein